MRLLWINTTRRPRFKWPWVHWCVFDRECRDDGCPADIYVHPLKLIIRLSER